jgi:CRP-like cAMP-binding protein
MRETVLAMLRHHPFVAEFEPRHVEKLATLAHEIRFERDQILFHEGDECSEFYLIVTGLVALEIAAPGHTFRVQTLFAGVLRFDAAAAGIGGRAAAGEAAATAGHVLSGGRMGGSVTGAACLPRNGG